MTIMKEKITTDSKTAMTRYCLRYCEFDPLYMQDGFPHATSSGVGTP